MNLFISLKYTLVLHPQHNWEGSQISHIPLPSHMQCLPHYEHFHQSGVLRSRDVTFLTKVHLVKSVGFSSSHVWMWEVDHKEGWAPKNLCYQTVLLEKTRNSPWDSKEIQPLSPTGNQPWMFVGRTDAEAETPIFWPPVAKNWLIRKDPDSGKDWGQEKKRATGWDGWMTSLTQWAWVWANPRDTERQGSLVCCSPWDCKESGMT